MLCKRKKPVSVLYNPVKYFPNVSTNKQKINKKSNARVQPKVKEINRLANLTHKNSPGANNWRTFLELQSKNSLGIKMDGSEEYTTPDTVQPAKSSSVSESKTKSKYNPTKANEKSISIKANKQKNKGVSSKGNTSDKTCPSPSKKGRQKYLEKPQRNIDENGITNVIAIDCEMVGVEVGVKKDMLARVSIVNSYGNCIYDTFVKPVEPVVDYRTFVSGVRPKDLENAPDFAEVQKKVADILEDRILVGHGLKKDLAVLFLTHPRYLIRDTTRYQKFRKGRPPALKKLAKEYLGVTIQEGEHSSVQDALAAMQLYQMFKKDWEATLKKKRKKHVKERQVTNLQAAVTQAMSLMDV